MLKIENLTWSAPDGEQIVKGINLTIPSDRLVAITGPNGGGKTTLAKLIAGLEKPDSGRILLGGRDITGLDITQRAQLGISFAFQQPVRFKGLTVRDLIEMAAPEEISDADMCDILGRVGLCAREYIDREVDQSLSGGEIKRIEIATVLARHSTLSVFDEPEAGIDLWSFSKLIDVFDQMRQSLKGTLIIISHQERILSIADELVVISNGRVEAAGPRAELLEQLLSGKPCCSACPATREEEAK